MVGEGVCQDSHSSSNSSYRRSPCWLPLFQDFFFFPENMTPKHRHVSDGTKVCLGSDLWDSLDPPPLSSHSRHLEDRQSNHDPSMLKPLKPYLLLNISHHRVVFSDDSISLGDLEGGSVKEKRKNRRRVVGAEGLCLNSGSWGLAAILFLSTVEHLHLQPQPTSAPSSEETTQVKGLLQLAGSKHKHLLTT